MLAVTAASFDNDDPLTGLEVGERPEPEVPDGWTTVDVRAASLNHHDLWSLRGVGLAEEQLPMILGCDAAGVDADGREVIVHAVVSSEGWRGDETLDPQRSLLSERFPGTLAERVAVPRGNLVPKPAELSFEEAACLPTAWLTAYRMLFTRARLSPGSTVLVQGAGGGVATACIALGRAAGLRVWASSRSEDKRARAQELGADATFAAGERLAERVDAGATSGPAPSADLARVFFLQLRVLGSTMGTRDELERLARFLVVNGVRPVIDRTLPLADARDGLAAMQAGEVFGKVVLTTG